MKKKLSVLCAVLLCLLLAAGCANKAEEDTGLAALQKSIQESGGTVGIAFLGYTDSEGTEETLKSLVKESACAGKYLSFPNRGGRLRGRGGLRPGAGRKRLPYHRVQSRDNRGGHIHRLDGRSDL